ncbi:uncharacterized protein Smp_201980 [Schistosoma mansoni]|uniref:uncharacterized protein n=1 Tax=Schistosoma mansoni TaxID=6183 RepID=UPI00022DC80C|nr:uncharacterized protein Smp_201980 [Schistosoma mansoni]|eukprot:XP_018650747.1 uncharacterized protein Smp_201980 [Schistosoma mansoni]
MKFCESGGFFNVINNSKQSYSNFLFTQNPIYCYFIVVTELSVLILNVKEFQKQTE